MKPATLATAVALALAATSSAAQEAPASSAQAPTPEAAARFIDSVIGNGVSTVFNLESRGSGAGGGAVESVSTVDCKTVVLERGNGGDWRPAVEVDWRSYVEANSFYKPDIDDRWGARVLARTTRKLIGVADPSKVNRYSVEQFVGMVVEPGAEALKDRLVRAMEFYGKSCAPKLDGPF